LESALMESKVITQWVIDGCLFTWKKRIASHFTFIPALQEDRPGQSLQSNFISLIPSHIPTTSCPSG
jgi:hypothetical protein